jgi:VIT1/CCC1 family predicted Fe2+/Mn2+ transporter
MSDSSERSSRSLSLTTGGITLLGVLLSIGVTVGIGVSGAWWVRVVAGVATTLVLAVVVKVGSRAGRGPLARLANWMIGAPFG